MAKVPSTPSGAPDLLAPPDIKIVPGKTEYVVNNCSSHPTWHWPREAEEGIPTCDGDCGTQEIDALSALVHNERFAWMRAGMAKDNVHHNIFDLDVQSLTLVEAMVESGVITRERLDDIYKTKMLEKMKDIREANESDIRKQRALMSLAVAQKKILGPDGQHLN